MKKLLIFLLLFIIELPAHAEWFRMNHPDTANIMVFGNRGDTVFTFQKDYKVYKTTDFGFKMGYRISNINYYYGIEATREGNLVTSAGPIGIGVSSSTDCGQTFKFQSIISDFGYNSDPLKKVNSRYVYISATFDWAHDFEISKNGLEFYSMNYSNYGKFIIFLDKKFITLFNDSLRRTDDLGKTYQYIVNPGITDLGLCEENSKGKLYMLVQDTLFNSIDSGSTWQRQSLSKTGLLYLNIDDHDNIYLRTSNKIYCSYDDCQNWTDISENLPIATSMYPEIRFSDTNLFTRADDGDIYFRDIYVGVKENPDISMTLTLYPNPVHDFLHISGSNNHSIQIYTIEGIQVLQTDFKDKIDVSSLATGMYFVKAGNQYFKFIKW
jgi:hypothetical protein